MKATVCFEQEVSVKRCRRRSDFVCLDTCVYMYIHTHMNVCIDIYVCVYVSNLSLSLSLPLHPEGPAALGNA